MTGPLLTSTIKIKMSFMLKLCKINNLVMLKMSSYGGLTNPAQNQGYELAHPYMGLIYCLREHMTGVILQTQRCSISKTNSNNRIS